MENGTLVTGIGKEEVEGCWLRKESFDGDAVANTSFHGGVDRAVCVYPFEHYALWEKQFGSTLPRPAFGEKFYGNRYERRGYIHRGCVPNWRSDCTSNAGKDPLYYD
ncbi:hypothetical protein GCM10020331_084070 [Ectobacillus funiculus]